MYQLIAFQRPVLQLCFSPDDHFLAASSEDCRVVIWDMRVLSGRKAGPSFACFLTLVLLPLDVGSGAHQVLPHARDDPELGPDG